MPTITTVTVKSSGGDYTSLNAAEAGEQADLVTADVQLDIECYAFDDTTSCSFNGWTTDATRYIRVFTPSTERHAGVWTTSKYRRRSSTGFGAVTTVNEDYVRFEGIQFYQPSGSYTALIRVDAATAASTDIRVTNCILNGMSMTTGLGLTYCGSGAVTIENSLAYGGSGKGIYSNSSSIAQYYIDNCTVVACGTYGMEQASTSGFTVRNTYVGGNGTDAYNGTFTRTTCMHSSATSYTGSTGSIAYDTSNFTNVTGGSEDLHLVTGSDLIDAGTDLSADFTIDIDGETRSGTWDIGADELVSGGAVVTSHGLSAIMQGEVAGGGGFVNQGLHQIPNGIIA